MTICTGRIFVVLAVVLLLLCARHVVNYIKSRQWQQAIALSVVVDFTSVKASSKSKGRGRDSITVPTVTYTFAVAGQAFSGNNYNFGNGYDLTKDNTPYVFKRNIERASHAVYYDPQNPSMNVMNKELAIHVEVAILIALILLFTGGGMVLYGNRSINKIKE